MLQQVRQAIADAVNAGVPDIQCSPYILGAPTPPSAYVYPGPVDYDEAMGRGMDSWELVLRAFVAETTDIGAQQLLDQMLEPSGTKSIKQAVEAKDGNGVPTLGGLVFNVRVTHCNGYQEYQVAGRGPVLGAEWTLEVKADG